MSQNRAPFREDKPLAVVVTVTSWHEPPRIRHQVTRQLTRFYNVLYVELPFGVPVAAETVEKVSDDLLIYRPSGLRWLAARLCNNVGFFSRRCNARLVRAVEARIRALGYERAVLVNFQFDFPEIMKSTLFQRRIYLCNDEFQTQFRWWTRAMKRHAENEVIGSADLCLAVSQPLVNKLQRCAAAVELFLPGHDFETDMRSPETSLRRRAAPIRVCYMGFINYRLRIDWLVELVGDPQVTLSLIGPIEDRQRFGPLLTRDNVEHVGALTGAELQRKMSASDVFILPYDATQAVVRAITAPNKLFQYLACGRPVVCAALPSLLPLPEKFVYVAADAMEFVRAVRAAFEEDSETLTRSRLDFSASNTWAVRGEALHNLLRRPEMGGAS